MAVAYVSDQVIGAADTGSISGSGDVIAAYGIYSGGDHSAGQYENFVVYGLPPNYN